MSTPNSSRRDFVKRIAYAAPSVLTLSAAPEYAKAGSVKPDPWGGWQKPDRGGGGGLGLGGGKGRGPDDKGRKRALRAEGKGEKKPSAGGPAQVRGGKAPAGLGEHEAPASAGAAAGGPRASDAASVGVQGASTS